MILYELNEVPWDIVDLYTAERPSSELAGLLVGARSLTTVNEDTVPFQPWRTWPTFHRSMYTDEHGSLDLGQDPATFEGVDMWTVADDAGRRVGLFGPMQSWPARDFRNGGFFVPDTFARSPECVPDSLTRFQAFNLAMTRENGFSSTSALDPKRIALAGVDLVRLGLTGRSAATLAQHLVRERVDARFKARRAVMQVLPSFDLYWKLHQDTEPDLSIFFTNHVAAMMHRYWGDGVPGYTEQFTYRPDDVYRGFLLTAMDLFDRQLGRIRRWMAGRDDTVLVIASSMGQGPIRPLELDETYVLQEPTRLAASLGFPNAEPGLAMYPRFILAFADAASAESAVAPIASVTCGGTPAFVDVRAHARTVSFEIDIDGTAGALTARAEWVDASGSRRSGAIGDVGLAVERRVGGGNTAYHIPEGIFIAAGAGIEPSGSREKVSVLDAAPSLLALLGVAPAPSMRGEPSIF